MRVREYELDGKQYREIISSQYEPLKDLKQEYERLNRRCWMNPYDDRLWVLTVEMEKEK